MRRIHVVLDPASVPIFADLVGFFHGGPLDRAMCFTNKRDTVGPFETWIVLQPENPLNDSHLSFAGLDNRRDAFSLRVYLTERVLVRPLAEPIQMRALGIFHDYWFRMMASIFGDVRVYLSVEATAPQEIPRWYVDALFEWRGLTGSDPILAHVRDRSREFYDQILGRFPGDNNWSWPSDPLSDVMEARRRIMEMDGTGSWGQWQSLHRPDIGSSTACFECGATVKTEHVWLKKSDPNVALCEGCFRTAETAGRAKEGNPTDDRSSALQ